MSKSNDRLTTIKLDAENLVAINRIRKRLPYKASVRIVANTIIRNAKITESFGKS